MKRFHLAILVFACGLTNVSAQSFFHTKGKTPTYNETIVRKYVDTLATIVTVDSIMNADSDKETTLNNPYYYPLLLNPTLYDSPINSIMKVDTGTHSRSRYLPSAYDCFGDSVQQYMTSTMMWAYTNVPWLVGTTQNDVNKAAGIRKEIVDQPVKEVTHITPQSSETLDLGIEDASYNVITRRPNFWSFSGKVDFSMSQNYVTDNWYQGNQNNNSFSIVTDLKANYNNQRGFSFNNNLIARLGFISQRKDTKHKYATNTDKLQLISSIGISAVKHWNYSLQLNVWTQNYPKYSSNSDNVTSDFLSPVEGNLSVGMNYSIDFSTKKRKNIFHFDANIAPLSYHAKYCDRKALRNNHGIPGKHHAWNDFGPNVTMNYSWQICKNIRTTGRIYYYSNLHYVSGNYTSTTDFTINKYLTTKLYMYTIFQDNRYVNGKAEFLQFQENLSLGLTVSF